ncbi:DUF58 domain-containing protein [Lysinibacter sp. HNR]|uniref:DUF58 domain-containing protein n=1 Tax=Lysinibacter sp. HNR TaxID=3031408 RepID=UPI002435E126|nr:DUF58 domain-containing protein [Lysinibacter sp. HNR]WGD37988.1 DUF58 domain-containing protein [Lysinibacter sp. HNR]
MSVRRSAHRSDYQKPTKADASSLSRHSSLRENTLATRAHDDGALTARADTGLGLSTARARAREAGVVGQLLFTLGRLRMVASLAITRGVSWLRATVTGVGWALLAIVPLGLISGYAWGWVEVLFLGYAAAALWLIALLFLLARGVYRVELVMTSERVVVGEVASGTATITNPTGRRLFPEMLEIPVGERLAEFNLPSLASGANFRGEFSIPTLQRGVITVGPARSVRTDPLLLLRRELVWTGGLTLFVHPVTVAIPSTSTGLVRDLEGNPTRDLTTSDISFHALREYVPGDDRRHIHWKSTARTGALMVRQYEQTRRSQLLIQLSTASSDYHTEEEFELAVSVVGSLGIRAIRDARDLAVTVGDELSEYAPRPAPSVTRLRVTSPSRLLDDLSGVSHSERSIPLIPLSTVSASAVTAISVAFMVCGSIPTAAQIRAASLAFPVDTEVVVVVCNPGIVPSVRRVSGLTVLTVGYLDDLARSLGKLAAS